MTESALGGIRVLDLTDERCIYGAKLLADMGADVVRPEPPDGDPLRRRGPFVRTGSTADGDVQASLYHAFFASNRQFLQDLDPASDLLTDLLAQADIVLTIDQATRGGNVLDLEAARRINPGLITIDTTSFGDGGPWQDFVAPDLVAGALAGAAAANGDVDTPPLKPFGELNFMVPGAYVAIAALAALHAREEAGVTRGTAAQVSVHESIASCLEQVFMFYWYADTLQRPEGRILPRRGSVHWSDAFAVLNGANGSIMMTPTPDFDNQLAWLVEENAHDDLIDPRYSQPENLRERVARTMEVLEEWVADKDVEQLFFAAQNRHLPYGWVQPLERVPDNPQLLARQWFVDYDLSANRSEKERENTGKKTGDKPSGQNADSKIRGPGAPYCFSDTPWRMAPSTNHTASGADDTSEDVLEAIGWTPRKAAGTASTPDTDRALPSRPLEGLKVLDFTHVVAGPFATRVLGDLGADVVKINSESRAVTSNIPAHPFYIMWNRNKRALALNMAEPEARSLCTTLAEQADVVIDNFSVGVLDRWGVGYAAISAANPRVIYAQMSGMGEGGPWSDFVTYAPTIHAVSGLTSLTGVPGRSDIGLGYSYNDHQAGLHGAVAILAALHARRRSGRGQRIDISQFEIGVNFAGPALLDVFANNARPSAMGNVLPYDQAAPHNVYPCAVADDLSAAGLPAEVAKVVAQRWIAIACMNDLQWQALCVVAGKPWATDLRFTTVYGRREHEDALNALISAWTTTQNDYDLMGHLQAAGVPAGVVQNGADLAERDPQLRRADFCHEIEDVHPDIGVTYADRLPIQFADMPCDQYLRVRALGEDNAAVLKDWVQMDAATVGALELRGILK